MMKVNFEALYEENINDGKFALIFYILKVVWILKANSLIIFN